MLLVGRLPLRKALGFHIATYLGNPLRVVTAGTTHKTPKMQAMRFYHFPEFVGIIHLAIR